MKLGAGSFAVSIFQAVDGFEAVLPRTQHPDHGDIPIFVARDSADVWAHRNYFTSMNVGQPLWLAFPGLFQCYGQLWGNPLYRWDVMAASGYDWWATAVPRRIRNS
jgi:4-alpha-glucanotransferase